MLNLIIALGLQIMFSENIQQSCNLDFAINGCINKEEKLVYLSYSSPNINTTLHHEIGHALFDGDKVIEKYMDNYEPWYGIFVFRHATREEKVADYYAEYKVNNKEFSLYYPCLYTYFQDKENEILSNTN